MVIDDSPSWTEQLGNGLLSLTMDSHRIGARNSPKQANYPNYPTKNLFCQLTALFIVRFVCLVVRP